MDTSRSPAVMPRPGAQISLRANLAALVLVCVAPALAVCLYLAQANARLQGEAVYRETEAITMRMVGELDRELAGIESGLKVLATSNALLHDDLAAFHRQASDALKSQVVYNYVLTDRKGRQVINTMRPYGSALPTAGTPPALDQVFATGQTVLTDIFVGPVTRKPAVAMGVPVIMTNGEARYSLNIGLAPQRLDALVRGQSLPDGWIMAVVDGSGHIVARSRDGDTFVGEPVADALRLALVGKSQGHLDTNSKEGVKVIASFARSQRWGWYVVTGAPREQLEASWRRTLLIVLLVGGGVIAAGGLVAYRLSQQVLGSVKSLNEAALSLRSGQPIALPAVQLREAEAVGQAIVQASQLMTEVQHRASHDALTNLGNREFFQRLIRRQVAESQRTGGTWALLALDLDHFKTVNDSQGHAVGDALLQDVARRIESTIRASDSASRVGGDEFCVFLHDADPVTAEEISARLVAALNQPYEGGRTQVTASIGIAVYPFDGTSPDQLMEAADRALYAVKAAGRNTYARAARASAT